MSDGGFADGWVRKIQVAVTKGQVGKPYEAELAKAVSGMLAQAKGWNHGPEEKLIQSVIAKLRFEADTAEMPDASLPDKLKDPMLARRPKLLREAISLIEEARS